MTKPSASSLRKLPAILVVDDEIRSQEALRRTLEEDFDVLCASGADEGMAILEREQPVPGIRIVLCDQRMPGTTGVQFLKEVRDRWPDIVRIILSGYTDAEDIITGVNEAGIWQYLLKPWQPEQLLLTLQRAAEVWRLQQENQRLSLDLRTAEPVLKRHVDSKQEKAKTLFGLAAVIRAPGSPLNAVCDLVQRVAPFDLSVMVTGESGTAKEMIARAIHYESRRASKAFVTENCGALPDTLLESELFGYKRGAFTGAVDDRVGLFQQADGGTLFLDEIGETSPAFQVKLLRVLQEGEFRPLGSNRPLPGRPLLPARHHLPACAAAARTEHGPAAARQVPAGIELRGAGQGCGWLLPGGDGLHCRLPLARQRARIAERNPAHGCADHDTAARCRPVVAARPADAGRRDAG